MQLEEYALKLNASDFASRSTAKAKPQKRDSAGCSTRTIPIGERIWTDVEPGEYSISDYEVSKKLIHLLRHGSLPRDNDEAIEFWRIEDHLQNHFVFCHHWSDEKWKNSMAHGGGNKKKFSIVLILQEKFFTSELFKVIQDAISVILHSQDNVINSERLLRVHLSHRMCNQFTLHHEFRIDTGRTKFEQKTDSILHVCGSNEQGTKRSV